MEKEQLVAELQTALQAKNQVQLQELAKQAVEDFSGEAFSYAFLAEAFLLSDNPEYPKAEVCLAKASELDAQNVDYLLRFAGIKEQQGEYNNSYLVYSKALDLAPNNVRALLACGLYQSRQLNDCDAAMLYFDRAIAATSDNSDAYFYRAEALANAGRNEAALADLDEVLSRGFDENAAILKIAVLSNLEKDGVDELYQALVQHQPESVAYHYNYANYLLGKEDYAAAETYFAKTVALIPASETPDASLFASLGDTQLHQQKYQAAKDNFDKALAANAGDLYTLLNRAIAKTKLNDFAGALQDLEPVLKDQNLESDAILRKAHVLLAMGKTADAEKIFQRIAQEGPNKQEGQYGLGVILHQKGDLAAAYKLLKQAKQARQKEAGAYIRAHFADFLAKAKAATLQQYAAGIAKNAQSPLVQKIVGTFWSCDSLKSELTEDMEPAMLERLKESLKSFSFFFTDKGLLLIDMGKAEPYTFQVDKQGADAAQLSLIALDGTQKIEAKFKLDGDVLVFSKQDGEFFRFKKLPVDAASAAYKQNLKEQLSLAQIDYLGDSATAVFKPILG